MKRWLSVIVLGLLATLLVGCGAGSVSRPEDVQRISPEDAKALLDEGRAVLYDTRSAAAHQGQRAAGAVSFPEADTAARIDELPDDGTAIILYCT
jgi:rhodanese-related sulfurtransferase